MAVISISLPDDLLEEADRVLAARGFSGRSEFVRACVRDFVAAAGAAPKAGDCTATLTLAYPEGHEREFSALRHRFNDTIRTVLHGHAGEGCLEVFVLEGEASRIQAFADTLRGTRTALQVALTIAARGRAAQNG